MKRAASKRSTTSLAIVLALHAGALYAITREADYVPPAVSVPMVVSLATMAEHQPTPKTKLITQPRREPVPSELPAPLPEQTQSSKNETAPPEIKEVDTRAAYLNNPKPDYPVLSRKLREEGLVMLRVYVDADGGVREVQIKASSGFQRLDRAAQECVSRWKFEPARQGREAIGSWTLIPMSFVINNINKG